MFAALLFSLLLAPSPVKGARASLVTIHPPEGGNCLAVPISQEILISALHCLGENNEATWRTRNGQGSAVVIKKEKEKDLIMLRAEGAGFHAMVLAKELPEETESVWAYMFIAEDATFDLVEGRAMRVHKMRSGAKVWFVDIMVAPGTSGGFILNAAGEVVGLVQMGLHPFPHPEGHMFFRAFAGVLELTRGSLK